MCCFDKTGTLTDSEFKFSGISMANLNLAAAKSLKPVDPASNAALVLAGCHSLTQVNGEIVGDPLEKVSL